MTTLREKMRQDLQLAGLSERTQEAYLRSVRKLAAHFRLPPDELTDQHLRDYFLHLKNQKQFVPATLKMACYGIRFFYTSLSLDCRRAAPLTRMPRRPLP